MRKFISTAFFALGVVSAAAQGGPGNGPGPGPAPQPWIVNGATVTYSRGGVALPANVTGGGEGVGTINVANGYYVAGNPLAFANIAGLGTAATKNIGTGGATVPLLSTANTWDLVNTFTSGLIVGTSSNGISFAIASMTRPTGNLTVSAPAAGAELQLIGGGFIQLQTPQVSPATNNATSLGTSSLVWSNVFASIGNFAQGNIANNVNNNTFLQISNPNAGALASARILLSNSVSTSNIINYGPATAGSGVTIPDSLKVQGAGTGGLVLTTSTTAPLTFGVNNAVVGSWGASGLTVNGLTQSAGGLYASGQYGSCAMLTTGNASNCGVFSHISDTVSPIEWAAILNMNTTHGSGGGGPNATFKGGLFVGVGMNPGSASTWVMNPSLAINAGTDLGTNHTANGVELDVTNRSTNVGDAAGYAGVNFLGGNVTGFTATGGGFAGGQYGYRNTYAYGVDGPGNIQPTTINAAAASGATSITVASAIFATGDGIRIIEGSAGGVGLNGTAYVGKVTAGGGTTTLTISPALTAAVGVGDFVSDVTGQTNSANWNRGFACNRSTVQSCYAMYGNAERGIDFQGARTDYGIDFALMNGLHTSFPIDIRFGSGHSAYYRNAAGTSDLSLWIFDGLNNWNIFAPTVFNGTASFVSSPTAPTPALTDNSTKLATTAYVQAQIVCTPASGAGFVSDGVTFNDTAFNNWWNTGADCLDFGKGKFAFAAKIDKTLSPAPQTIQLASGTYNSTTGIASVTATGALTFPAGSSITVWNATGTGAFASMNGTFTSLSVSGSTATYAIQPGLGATTLTGGGISGANRRSAIFKGAASNLTRLYWPNSSCGIKITQGGTTTQFGAYASSFHIRDMTLATGSTNCGIGLDLEGFPFAFGAPPVTDIENVEIEGDDQLAPIEGSLYWSAAVNINCWSNINVFNLNTYGSFSVEKGVGLIYGCNQGTTMNPTYAVILNINQSSFNGHTAGFELLSYWQGVTLNQVNINAENGVGTAGVLQAGGQTGVLSGLAITSSQFGQLNNPIALAPASGSAVSGLNITNNTLFVSIANALGMQIGVAGNPAQVATITGNTFIGNPALTSTFGLAGEMQGATATGNVFSDMGLPIDIAAGSDSLSVTGNSARGTTALPIANNGCTNCFIANNPGINPIGVTPSTTVGASPATICASSSPETHYFTQSATFGATVKLGTTSGPIVGTMSSATATVMTNLGPNECEVVTWATTAPTYSKSIH